MADTFKAYVAAHLVVKKTFLDFSEPEQRVRRRSRSLPAGSCKEPERYFLEDLGKAQLPRCGIANASLAPAVKPPNRWLEPPLAPGRVASQCSTASLSRAPSSEAPSTFQWERSTASPCRSPRSDKSEQGRTTIMMKHIPNNYTPEMLIAMLDKEGFSGLYDFAYLPMDFRRRAGLGYAFVNLSDPAVVDRFWRTFAGYSSWDIPTQKICELSWSTPLQGLQAHIARFRNLPVMHPSVPENYKPMLFEKGLRIPFPPPTKGLKAPFKKA